MTSNIARRIKPAHLELIQKIVETQKLQLAAHAMALSQPAASRILADIETTIGTPLFIRHPKGMEPTPAGHAFCRHARVILSEVETLEYELRHLQTGELGEVRVGSVTGPAVGCLMPAVHALQQDAPELEINVDVAPSTSLIRWLNEGRFDFIIGRIPPNHDSRDFLVHPARTEIVSPIVHQSHPMAGQRNIDLSELTAFPWVMQERGMPIRQMVEEAFYHAAVSYPPRVVNSSSLLVALAQVAQGRAITPQSDEVRQLLVSQEIGANLTALHLRHQIVVPPYFIIRHRNRQLSRAAERLLEEVLQRI